MRLFFHCLEYVVPNGVHKEISVSQDKVPWVSQYMTEPFTPQDLSYSKFTLIYISVVPLKNETFIKCQWMLLGMSVSVNFAFDSLTPIKWKQTGSF